MLDFLLSTVFSPVVSIKVAINSYNVCLVRLFSRMNGFFISEVCQEYLTFVVKMRIQDMTGL